MIAACERRGATNVRVFGSVARAVERDTSDLDPLVDLEDQVSVISLIGLERELSDLLGVDVDVVPAAWMKPRVGAEVAAEAIPL